MTDLLTVQDLQVCTHNGVALLRGIGFSLSAGECLALVGESGSGKSLTALSLLRLLPEPQLRISGGSIRVHDTELASGAASCAESLRGRVIGLVTQDPQGALHPCLRIGEALTQVVQRHQHCDAAAARDHALRLLAEVSIDAPEQRCRQWPHQLSGGLRQRVALAMALAGDPQVLIADEPTTALDVTVQAQILGLLDRLRRQRGLALLLITHDLGVVAAAADRVAVLYAGRIVESGDCARILAAPAHPYTQALLASVPRVSAAPRTAPQALGGMPPLPAHLPSGCALHPRCPVASAVCAQQVPALLPRRGSNDGRHSVACLLNEAGP